MKTKAIIDGLTILQKYMNEDGYNCGAECEAIYFYPTDKPVVQPDLDRLVELGWYQQDTYYDDDEETGGEFGAKHYDQLESWMCRT